MPVGDSLPVLSQSRAECARSVQRHQSSGAADPDGREPGRAAGKGPRLLLFQCGVSPARLSAGGLAFAAAAIRSSGRFVGTCSATAAQCPAALGFLGRQFQVLRRSADSDLGFGKLDWSASDRNHLSASFNYLKWLSPNGFQTQAVLNDGQGVGANGNSSVRTRYGRLAWTSIPRASRMNELRFGWFKDRHADNLNQSLVPPETGLVQITVEGQPYLGSAPTCRGSTRARTGSRSPTR